MCLTSTQLNCYFITVLDIVQLLRSWHYNMCNNDVGMAALGVSWNVVRIGYQHLQEAIPYAVVGLSFEAKIIITKI